MQILQCEDVVRQLNLVVCKVTSITGTVSRDDIDDAEAKKVFTSGAVRYIDPGHLNPFTSARTASGRAGRSAGVRFFDGYGVTDEQLPKYLQEIQEIGARIEACKNNVVKNWDALLSDWQTKHPEARRFSGLFPSRSQADAKIGITVSIVKINPAQTVVPGVADGLKCEIEGLAGRVIEEIALDVRDSWTSNSSSATQRIKNLLNRTKDKARSLSFLDGGRLGELALFIEETIDKLPVSGTIEGNDFLLLSGLMSILSCPHKMAAATLSIVLPQDVVPEAKAAPTKVSLTAKSPRAPVTVQESSPVVVAVPAVAKTAAESEIKSNLLRPPPATPAAAAYDW